MSRHRDPDKPRPPGKFGENRECWVEMNGFQIVLYVKPGATDDEKSDMLTLSFYAPGRRMQSMVLTGFTGNELRAAKDFITAAFDRAIPISDDLDRHAQEAWRNGDDSYPRAYRGEPKVHNRIRPREGRSVPRPHRDDGSEPEHDPQVPGGLDGSAPVGTGPAPD